MPKKKQPPKFFQMKKDKAQIVFDFAQTIGSEEYPEPLARTALCLASCIQSVPQPLIEKVVRAFQNYRLPELGKEIDRALQTYKYHDGKSRERIQAGRRYRRARRQLFAVLAR